MKENRNILIVLVLRFVGIARVVARVLVARFLVGLVLIRLVLLGAGLLRDTHSDGS